MIDNPEHSDIDREDMIKFVKLTQCMPGDKETAFALILEANISGRSSAGTGPASRENDKTYLMKQNQSNINATTQTRKWSPQNLLIK